MGDSKAPTWEPTCKVVDEEPGHGKRAIRAVACGEAMFVSASSRPMLKVWQMAEAKVTLGRIIRHGGAGASCVEVADHGRLVATCLDNGRISLWDARQAPEGPDGRKPTAVLKSDICEAFQAKFLPDNVRLVSGGSSGSLQLWDLRVLGRERSLDAPVTYCAPRADVLQGKRKRDGTDDEPEAKKRQVASPIYSLGVSRNGQWVACGRGSGEISVARLESLEWIGDVQAHLGQGSSPVRSLAFDAASRMTLTGGDDGHICQLDAALWGRRRSDGSLRRPQLERFPGHTATVSSVSPCPDPRLHVVLSASLDGSVKLWDARTHQLLRTYKEHGGAVNASAFGTVSGKTFFVTGGADATLALHLQA